MEPSAGLQSKPQPDIFRIGQLRHKRIFTQRRELLLQLLIHRKHQKLLNIAVIPFPGVKMVSVHHRYHQPAVVRRHHGSLVPQHQHHNVADRPVQAQESRRSRALVRKDQAVIFRTTPELTYCQARGVFSQIACKRLAQRHASLHACVSHVSGIPILQRDPVAQADRPHVYIQSQATMGSQRIGRSLRHDL